MKSPLSGAEKCSLLNEIDTSLIQERWKREIGIDWLPPASAQTGSYWLDETTGLRFYMPAILAGGPDLYSQLQRFPWYYMDEKWEFNAALRRLQSLPSGSRVLEIGVGQGAFLEKAKRVGLQICGMELNPAGARAARGKGFTIVEKDMAGSMPKIQHPGMLSAPSKF